MLLALSLAVPLVLACGVVAISAVPTLNLFGSANLEEMTTAMLLASGLVPIAFLKVSVPLRILIAAIYVLVMSYAITIFMMVVAFLGCITLYPGGACT